MRLRIAQDYRLKGLTRQCPDCGNEMTSTGEIQYDEDMETWLVNFWCPFNKWFVPVWSADLDPLISEVTRDLDPSTLPLKEY